MTEQASTIVKFNDLGISKELENADFRNQFFRTEREIDIPFQIRNLRKLRKMNQKELAEIAGTQQSAISRLERSEDANWELETLVKLAEGLGARLSVVIEPFEDVMARYAAEETTQVVSAVYASPDVGQRTLEKSKPTSANLIGNLSSSMANIGSKDHGISGNRSQPISTSNTTSPTARTSVLA